MSLRGALRAAASDFYFNSWRLVPANLVWGAVLVMALLAPAWSPLGLLLLVTLAVPTAGLYRMTALLARGEPAGFSDFLAGMRRDAGRALALGAASIALVFMLMTNVLLGLASDHPVGWFVSAMALWGLVGLAMLLVAVWPLLADPHREGAGLRRRLYLAAVAVIGRPGRMLVLTAVVAVVLVVSAVLFALLAMVAMSFAALLSSRYVLPLVDELEARLPAVAP